jgi:hypothetical protein
MEWPNRIALFVLGLIVLILIQVFWIAFVKPWLQRLKSRIQLHLSIRRSLKEMKDVLAGKKKVPKMISFDARPDGGMIVRTYKEEDLVSEEIYSAWEWEQRKKVSEEKFRKLLRHK